MTSSDRPSVAIIASDEQLANLDFGGKTEVEILSGLVDWYRAALEQTVSPHISCQKERDAGNGGCGTCVICCKEATDERDAWREVIAALCGDGGHYHQKHGTKATKDYALGRFYGLVSEIDRLRVVIEIIKKRKRTLINRLNRMQNELARQRIELGELRSRPPAISDEKKLKPPTGWNDGPEG